MAQDTLTRIRERYKDAADFMREQHARMREDADFSNPAMPQQWDAGAKAARAGRPMLVFDKSNQFIAQVVNDMRQNKPQIQCLPADSYADIEVAKKLNGIIKHIEYVSRAGIAYDTAGESQVRLGLGWLRVVPQIMRPETNEQEIRIMRVHDPMSVMLDPNSTEPDGSDAMWGVVSTRMTLRAFKAAYPKAKAESFETGDYGAYWFGDDFVTVCEYFEIEETSENRLVVEFEGQRASLTEDEYWQAAQAMGMQPPVVEQFESKKRSVTWKKVTCADVLEQTDFPSQYLPLIPVMGHEMWIDGRRYLCGMVRRLADAQRFHNYTISAAAEAVALQPKAPFIGAAEAIEGHDEWQTANTDSHSILPFNHMDEAGNPIPTPQRVQPPVFSQGWAELIQYSASAMEASVGMFAANLGKKGNATSGRQELAQQREGDTANFHFADNLARSIEQLGRVVVDMIPRIYDTPRQARIVGEDGSQDFVQIDPSMQTAAKKNGKKVVAINPTIGAYDVRVKSGPSYTSLRQESAEQMGNLIQASPEIFPLIGDEWIKAQDWPGAEKIAQRLKAMLPPQIQALEDDGQEMPPEALQKIQSLQQQIEQLSHALENAAAEADSKQIDKEKAEADMLTNGYKAVTERISALAAATTPKVGPEGETSAPNAMAARFNALLAQTLREAGLIPPTDPQALQPEMPEQPMQQPMQPPQGGFPEGFQQ
jgi:hypothetical protein